MASPDFPPKLQPEDFDCAPLAESDFGELLRDNEVDLGSVDGAIRVLTEASANTVWATLFGPATHKYKIAEDNWSSCLAWAPIILWIEDYNRGETSRVQADLRALVEWPGSQMVLFVKGPYEIVSATWEAFARHWNTFAQYDNDGPFILPVNGVGALRILPLGAIARGVPA